MGALIWGAWGAQWALEEKVSFNGSDRTITVHSDVTTIDIAPDVYSAWVRWVSREQGFLPAMRYSGYDEIPGGRTGATFFLINGWKLVYNPNTVAVSGVLYSEDYATAFWSESGSPIYPATVSALVNSAVSYQNVVSGVALTAEETANAVWLAASRTLTASLDPNVSQIASAVLAQILASVIPANVVQMNAAEVIGTGTLGDDWRGVGVPPQ